MRFKQRFGDIHRRDILDKSQRCIWIEEGAPGLRYLIEKRRLSKASIKDYGLGYIPANIPHQLAGRIIFPLYDPSGNLIVLTSRNVDGSDFLPVYWHEQYKKSYYVYGLDKAKKAIRQLKFIIIVEGQIDVLQLYGKGIENVIGLGCTTLSGIQLASIYRYCDEVVLLLDSDPKETNAGQKGVTKILQLKNNKKSRTADSFGETEGRRQTTGHKITSVSLPIGMDPDSYVVKYGVDELKKMISTKIIEMRNNEHADNKLA